MKSALTPLDFLARSAFVYRDKIAVVDGERRFTYDEFNQRIHLIALACAFAAAAVVSYTSDLLFQAGFIRQFPATGLWALMVAIWFVAMIVTPRYYR